jgi:ABC-type lipoprotein export system ATPase subunit
MTLCELIEVRKQYGAEAPVLDTISLTVAEGETLAVGGPSGSGKSTLLNLMGGLDVPTAGRVRFAGQDLQAMGERGRAEFRRRQVGFVFQRHFLLPQLTVLENVLVPTLAGQANGKPDRVARGLMLLERAGLGGKTEAMPGELSGGERQRVAVVRALINEPRLLLADEPTGSLDADTASGVVDLLLELNREAGVAVVMVTHSPALARRMGLVLEITDGALVPVA